MIKSLFLTRILFFLPIFFYLSLKVKKKLGESNATGTIAKLHEFQNKQLWKYVRHARGNVGYRFLCDRLIFRSSLSRFLIDSKPKLASRAITQWHLRVPPFPFDRWCTVAYLSIIQTYYLYMNIHKHTYLHNTLLTGGPKLMTTLTDPKKFLRIEKEKKRQKNWENPKKHFFTSLVCYFFHSSFSNYFSQLSFVRSQSQVVRTRV